MLLFVGLGNPGSQYVRNRQHRLHGGGGDRSPPWLPPWKRRFQGVTAEGTIGGERVLLLLPGTYMNESGRAVQEASLLLQISLNDIVVFQDEVDLPPAKLRVKTGGGNAGITACASISAHVGNDYRRVRIGVGHPGVKELVHGHVLSDFSKADKEWVRGPVRGDRGQRRAAARGQDPSVPEQDASRMAAKGFDKDEGKKSEGRVSFSTSSRPAPKAGDRGAANLATLSRYAGESGQGPCPSE